MPARVPAPPLVLEEAAELTRGGYLARAPTDDARLKVLGGTDAVAARRVAPDEATA